ncbi:hypothetical protein CHUAL_000427 [Chamberlinius hualienensis]
MFELPELTKDLTKVNLNKQRVHLRKIIKRAKLHTISSLVHKLAKLKKSAEKGVQKAKRKSERLLVEINEIKCLKLDDISRFALTNQETFAVIAKKGTSKERALARISEHRFVAKEIKDFREEFPKWAIQVPSLFNLWDFQNNVMNKRGKNKMAKEELNPSITNTGNEGMVQHKNDTKKRKKNIKKPSSNDSTFPLKNDTEKKEIVSDVEDDVRSDVIELEDNDREENNSSLLVINDDEKEDSSDSFFDKEQDHKHLTGSVRNPDKINANKKMSLNEISQTLKFQHSKAAIQKVTGDMEIRILNLNEDAEEFDVSSKSKNKKSNPVITGQKPRSSFFLDMDDNELSDQIPEDEPTMSEVSESVKSHPNKKFRHNDAKNQRNFKSNTKTTRQSSKQTVKSNKSRQPESRTKGVQQPSPLPTVLHPSWEAKRKLNKTAIQEFKGTKIKFDDD